MKSKIFTKTEIKEIQKRQNKNYKDTTGIFSNRIKPKIKEILEKWIPKQKELEKLIEKKNKKIKN